MEAAARKTIVFQGVLTTSPNAQCYDTDMPEPPTAEFLAAISDMPEPPPAEFFDKTAEKVESVPVPKDSKQKDDSLPQILILILLPVVAIPVVLFLLFKAGVLIFLLAGFFIFSLRLWS